MLKKLTLLAMSVAALVALAAPAAQASEPVITNASGEPAQTVVATGTNVRTITPAATLECATVNLHIELSENTNGTATGSGTGEALGNPKLPPPHETCGASNGLTVKITHVTVLDIHFNSGGSGTASFTYEYDLYSHAFSTTIPVGKCHIEGTAAVAKVGTSTISILGKGLVGKGAAPCPASGEILGEFHLDDENGEPAHID